MASTSGEYTKIVNCGRGAGSSRLIIAAQVDQGFKSEPCIADDAFGNGVIAADLRLVNVNVDQMSRQAQRPGRCLALGKTGSDGKHQVAA